MRGRITGIGKLRDLQIFTCEVLHGHGPEAVGKQVLISSPEGVVTVEITGIDTSSWRNPQDVCFSYRGPELSLSFRGSLITTD